jgi:hypothetical protein
MIENNENLSFVDIISDNLLITFFWLWLLSHNHMFSAFVFVRQWMSRWLERNISDGKISYCTLYIDAEKVSLKANQYNHIEYNYDCLMSTTNTTHLSICGHKVRFEKRYSYCIYSYIRTIGAFHNIPSNWIE